MLLNFKRGQGSIVLRVKILDSSVSTGAGKTGLTSASSGLIISTIADNEATATAYTVAGSTIETITTLGTFAAPTATKCRFKEVDATNHKGVYEIQIADARFAVSSAKSLLISILGATNAAETDVVISLQDLDPYDSVRAGLTSLPNAAAAASGGLPTIGATIPNATAGAAGGLFIAGSNAATTVSGLTTGALNCTTITASGATSLAAFSTSGTTTLNALTVTNATTLSGAVSLGSTLGVTGTTTLAAVTTGAVTFSAFTVSGATTLAALSATTITASGATSLNTLSTSGTTTLNALTVTNATTYSGAVSLGSTLTIGGTTSLQAVDVNGATTLNAMTIYGAVTATHASNNVTGITVKALAANVITAASIATDATDAITESIYVEAYAGQVTAGSFGDLFNGLKSAMDSISGGSLTDGIVDGVWDAARTDHTAIGSFGVLGGTEGVTLANSSITDSVLASTGIDAIVDGVWDELAADHTDAGSFGDYLDAEVSGVSGGGGITVADIWNAATSGLTTADSIGKRLADNIDVASSTLATAANLATVAGYLDTEIAAIKAKTDNLPSDPADQSAVEAAITAATSPLATQASVNDLPTNAELATALASADDAVLAAIAALERYAVQFSAAIDGSDIALQAWLTRDGVTVDLSTVDPDAECVIVIKEQTSGTELLNETSSTITADDHFEVTVEDAVDETNADKNYFARVTITVDAVDYVREFPLTTAG